jgi:two-component system, cell cycle sensor histidine kinase and response regulator CckA
MHKARILILEDQLIVAEDLARLLKESGYEVIGISDSSEAVVKTALRTSPDLVLLDIQLQGTPDGIEAARLIRNHLDPAIVYVTAHSEKGLFERARETEPDGYLYKPVSPVELIRTVEIVLFKQAMQKKLRESEQRYRTLVENSFDGIFVQKGTKIAFANARLHEMLGYEPGELIGKDHWVMYHSDYQQMIRDRAEARLRGESVIDHYEVILQTKDGVGLDGDIRAKEVFFDGELCIQICVRDISEQKRSQERFQTFVESAPFGLAIIGEDGRFKYCNPHMIDILGYSVHEIQNGASWLRRAYPDPDYRREVVATWIQDCRDAKPGAQRPRVFTVTCNDNTVKDVLFRPVQLRTGEHLMTLEDITDRKRAEERLRQSEEEFRRIVENLQDAFYRADMNGILTFLSPASERIAGYRPEEGVGRPIRLFYADPLEREEFMKLILKDGFVNNFEARLVHKDGHIVWVSTSARLYKDKQGNLAGVEGIARDISNRKKAAEAVRASEAKYRRLHETMSDAFVMADMSGRIQETNQAYQDMLGYSEEELRKLTYVDLTPEKWHSYEASIIEEQILQRGCSDVYQKEYRKKHGTIFPVELRTFLIRDETGQPSATWSIVRDISKRKTMEEALRHSEEKFRLIFEFSPLGVVHFDQTGTITECNDNLVAIIGSSRKQLIGIDAMHDVRDPNMRGAIKEALQGRTGHYEGLYSSITAPKTTPVKCDFAPILSEDGTVLGSIGIVEDITERKKAEEALFESETRFRRLMEHSPMAIAVTDMKGEVEYLNKKFGELFGYTIQDIPTLDHWWYKAYPDPQTAERVRSEWLHAMKEAEKKGMEAGPTEREVRCKDGTTCVVDFRKTVVDRWAIHTLLDITESKTQKEALRESEQMFRLLSEQSLMSVAILQDGVYKYTNQAMSDLCEYSPEEIAAWGPEEFLAVVHPADRSLVLEQARLKQTGDPAQKVNYPFRIVTKSGKTKWVEIYSKTVRFRDRSANLLTMIDITGRKQAEERLLQSQKMEAIGTLAGGIAHDLNNLLQVVLGHADMLLLREVMDEKSGRSVKAIRRAARNGADLVGRILAFSRKSDPDMKAVDLNEEVRRFDELLRRTIPKMISLEMSLAKNPLMIRGDSSQIEQILLNLAANARDAMPEGGRLVFETGYATIRDEYFQIHPGVKPGKYVLLTVSDTGHGMARNILDRMFEPFFTTKQPGQGTGLGLSMVFGIVKSHGGHITCYSEPGTGSTFKIYFPVVEEDFQPDLATTTEMPAYGTETLLLVDDEDAVRALGAEMLELAGYTVITAARGREALEIYHDRGDSIALVVLDLVMPEMSGRQCLEELLKMNPRAKVLIASGYAANGPAREARESGAAGFVGKPYDLKQILIAIRKSLDGA